MFLAQERSYYYGTLFIIHIYRMRKLKVSFFLSSRIILETIQVIKPVLFSPSWRVALWHLLRAVRFQHWFRARRCPCPRWWRTRCCKWIQQCKDHGKLYPFVFNSPPKGNLFQLASNYCCTVLWLISVSTSWLKIRESHLWCNIYPALVPLP